MTLLHGLAAIDIDPYAFACDETLFSVPHFFNVVTNLSFLLVGVWGLLHLARAGRLTDRRFVNWVGLWTSVVVLTFGSGAYHWYLTPATLAFDRFCITSIIAFLGAEIIAAVFGWGPSRRLSLLFVVLSAGTVVAWLLGTTSWFYGVLQAAGGLGAVGVTVWAFRRGRIGREVLQPVLLFAAFYGVAKIFEVLDAPICDLTGGIGGHPVKHLLSAAGLLCLGAWMKSATQASSRAAG